MADRKDRSVAERLEARDFRDAAVCRYLDQLAIESVRYRLGEPRIVKHHQEPVGLWQPSAGRPALASEDPATMEAIGRCAMARTMATIGPIGTEAYHPAACGWCEYPLEQLLTAADWSVAYGQWLVDELWVWDGHGMYVRTARSDEYDNPAWARFYALPWRERRYQVERAMAA